MNIYPITFFFALIKYSPLFIRELIEYCWAKILRVNSESIDKGQAKIIAHVLRAKGVKITGHRLQRLFSLLPNHISIDAKERVPAVLNGWNIITSVRELTTDDKPIDFSQPAEAIENTLSPSDLYDINTPALIRLNNGNVAALLNIADDIDQCKKSVIIYDSQQGVQLISFNTLIEAWSGSIFDFDLTSTLVEPKFNEKNTREKWQNWTRPGSILLSFITLLTVIHFQFSHYAGAALFTYIGITLCLLVGLGLSLLLAQHGIGDSNGILAKYCSSDSQHNCQQVLDSPNAKFLGVSHADIGVGYFGGSLLLFFISLLTVDAQPYIHTINSTIINLSLLALLYSGYSLFLQKYKVKQWCRLCLYTQAAIIVQALLVLLFLGFSHHTGYEHFSFSLTSILLITPGVIWYFLRTQQVTKTIQAEQQYQLEQIISSDELIEKILANKQRRLNSESDFSFDVDEDLESDIILRSGIHNEHSQPLRIVLGLSPSCEHCGSLLEEIYQFMQADQWKIECHIRLIIGEGDGRDARIDRVIAEHITAFVNNNNEGQSVAINTLRNWYQEYNAINIKEWLSTVRNISEAESVDISVLLADTSFWVNQKDISVIPAMYIENNYIPFISEEHSTILLRKINTT